jgi:hypothetical protein
MYKINPATVNQHLNLNVHSSSYSFIGGVAQKKKQLNLDI